MVKRSKCLSDMDIQLFIDDEISMTIRQEIQLHLSKCDQCRKRVGEQLSWIGKVKISLKNEEVQEVMIPQLKTQLIVRKDSKSKIFLKRMVKSAAIIAILLGTYLVLNEKEKPAYKPTARDLILWEENTMGNDANQFWHSRMISITETNSRGEVKSIEAN